MAEENNENLDSLNEEGNQDAEKNLENAFDENDDAEALKEKNKQLFARAKKAETEVKKMKEVLEKEQKEKEEKEKEKPKPSPEAKSLTADDVLQVVKQQLEERELSSLGLADELKQEIKDYAKMKNISVSEAAKSDYIQFKKEQVEKKIREERASASSKNRTSGTAKRDFKEVNPNDFDLKTKEGRAEFEEYKKYRKSLES